MAEAKGVLEANMVFEISAGEAIDPGELLYWDSTNSDWRLADADASAISGVFPYARLVAISKSDADGDVILAAKETVLFDSDDNGISSSNDAALYLSDTAGAITTTRPTGANDLKQRVGTTYQRAGGTGSSYAHIHLEEPREVTINVQFPYTESAAPQDFNGDFHGVGLDDTNAAVGGCFMVPENATGRMAIAYLWLCGTGTALDASDTYTFDVSAGIDDETTSASSDGISAASLEVAASDLARKTVTTGFDTNDILEPGNVVGIDVKKAAEGAGGDDPIMLCCSVVIETVN